MPVTRIQLRFAPETVRTVQTGQGVSIEALIGMLNKNAGQTGEDLLLHVYVFLSRVRHIDQLLLYGLPDKICLRKGLQFG